MFRGLFRLREKATDYIEDRFLSTRHLQEEIDTLNMFHVSQFYKNFRQKRKSNPDYGKIDVTMEEQRVMTDQILGEKMSHRERKAAAFDVLDEQVSTLFDHVVSTGGINPYPKPKFRPPSSADTLKDPTRLYLSRRMNIQDVEIFNPGIDIEHPDGFSLQIKKSDIDHPDSGYGVFVKGEVIPGTVLALYPGVVYWPRDITKSLVEGNEYMITRYDQVLIDGRHWENRAEEVTRGSMELQFAMGEKAKRDLLKYRNPYGIGQYINHPGKGKVPNVMSYSFDFPLSIPESHKPFIPNFNNKEEGLAYTSPDVYQRAVIIVASKRLVDEEVLMNYRYSPFHPYPEWYHQPDEDEARRRWTRKRTFE